jgi:WD40 repeat protein
MGKLAESLNRLPAGSRLYRLQTRPQLLAQSGQAERLFELLTDFVFIEAKVSHPDIKLQELIEDYDRAFERRVGISGEKAETLRLIQGAIRLSAHILDKDKTQLAGQLLGRLMSFEVPEIHTMLEQAQQGKKPWLRHLKPSLTQAGSSLLRTLTGHTDFVTAVVITPDGQWAISGSKDLTLKLWDLASGTARHTMIGHTNFVTAVAVTPDRQWALSGSADCTLKLWDLESGTTRHTLIGHTEAVTAVALTPDGRWAISGTWNGTLRLWDLVNGTEQLTLTGYTKKAVTALVLAPDGQQAFSGSRDGTVIVWNLSIGIGQYMLTERSLVVRATSITPDGQWALSGSNDGTLKLWDLNSGTAQLSLSGHTDAVTAVAMTPDGQWALSGSEDSSLKLWDLNSGTAQCTLTDHAKAIRCVAITPDKQWAVSGSRDGTLKLWDLARGYEQHSLIGHSPGVEILAMTSDGRWALSCSEIKRQGQHSTRDSNLKLWNLASGTIRYTLTGHTREVTAVAMTPDGRWALSGSKDTTLKLWDLINGTAQRTLYTLDAYDMTAIAMTPDGRWALSGTWNGSLKLWDLTSGTIRCLLKGHTSSITVIAITPDGRCALSGSEDSSLKLWDLANVIEQLTLPEFIEPLAQPLNLGIDITRHALIEFCCGVQLFSSSWEFATKQPALNEFLDPVIQSFGSSLRIIDTAQCTLYALGVGAIAISPDGQWAISSHYDTLKLWNLVSGTEQLTLEDQKPWNLVSGIEQLTLEEQLQLQLDYIDTVNAEVNAVALTPDGQYAISASNDNTLRVWDLESGRVIARFIGDSALNFCAIAPDGVTIVAGEASGRVHFLRLEGIARNG